MRLLGSGLLCLLIACSESFVPAWAVTDLRVVGARVELPGKPGRARPDPGDEIQVSVQVIDQGAPPPPPERPDVPSLTPSFLQWTFVACIPEATLIGPPICRDIIQPCDGCDGAPPVDPLAFPVLRFQVPSEEAFEAAGADRLVVQGVVCIHGVPPSLEAIARIASGDTNELQPCSPFPEDWPIRDDEDPEGRIVTIQIPVEVTPDDPNLNPVISKVTYEGGSWPLPYNEEVPRSAPREGCVEDLSEEEREAHPIAGSSASSINLSVPKESLQPYTVGDITLTEEIQVSWLTDGGDFERTFSFITDPDFPSILTHWRPFPEVPEEGVLVRFNFVIRDGRGGTDWVERGLCIRPKPPDESPP